MQKPFSAFSIEKKNIIFSFYLFYERVCRVDFPHAFQDSFSIEILFPGERFLVPWCHLTRRNAGYAALIILRSVALLCCFAFFLPLRKFLCQQWFQLFVFWLFLHPILAKWQQRLSGIGDFQDAYSSVQHASGLLLSITITAEHDAYRLRGHSSTF